MIKIFDIVDLYFILIAKVVLANVSDFYVVLYQIMLLINIRSMTDDLFDYIDFPNLFPAEPVIPNMKS